MNRGAGKRWKGSRGPWFLGPETHFVCAVCNCLVIVVPVLTGRLPKIKINFYFQNSAPKV